MNCNPQGKTERGAEMPATHGSRGEQGEVGDFFLAAKWVGRWVFSSVLLFVFLFFYVLQILKCKIYSFEAEIWEKVRFLCMFIYLQNG